MARIRSIKPDAFKSESLSRLDYLTRWTFAGLWTYLDDSGYGRADARLIRAELFPLDDDVTVGKVTKSLDALHDEGCVCRFTVDGREYIHAPNWQDHQKVNRPTASKFPPCPEHDGGASGEVSRTAHGELSEDSVRTHGGKGTGNREQGRSSSADADGAFDEFWDLYPRKVAKGGAQRAYAKALKKTSAENILTGLRAHLPGWSRSDIKFVPHPATWLNDERWADTVEAPRARDSRPEGW